MKTFNQNLPYYLSIAWATLLGTALRLWLVMQSGWRIDYDEGMIGLLGMQVLDGARPVFVPAQATLGAIEAYLLVPFFETFGANVVGFRALSLGLSAAYIVTTGWLGWVIFGRKAAPAAALLAAIAPPYMLITGLKTWGVTIETIILGNQLLIFTALLTRHTTRAKFYFPLIALFGLVTGIMFWIGWLGFYYIIPAIILLFWKGRYTWRAWGVAIITFFIGSFPFWHYNVTNQFQSIRLYFGESSDDLGSILPAVFADLFSELLPRLISSSTHWESAVPSWATSLAIFLYGVGIVYAVASRRVRKTDRRLLLLFLGTVIVVYLLSGFGRNALNPYGIDATGRYVLMLHTLIPLGIAGLVADLFSRRTLYKLFGVTLFTLVIAINLWGSFTINPIHAFDSPYYTRLPLSLDPLIDYLESNEIQHVWTEIGLGHVLMFETQGRILAGDFYDKEIANGLVRFPEAYAAVEEAERVAFVGVIRPNQSPLPMQTVLDALNIPYTLERVTPDLAVYIPLEPVSPATISGGLGPQFFD